MKSYLISAVLGVAALVMTTGKTPVESTVADIAHNCPCGDACACDPCQCGDTLSIAAPVRLAAQITQSPFIPNETDRLQEELDIVKSNLAAANRTIETVNQTLSTVQAKSASWDSGLVGPRLTEADVLQIVAAEIEKTKSPTWTEEQIRALAREEAEKVYAAKVTVQTPAGVTRTQTVKTSAVSPGQIVLNPGEVLVEIDGVPVQQTSVYSTGATYSTPSYSVDVPRNVTRSASAPVYRTPVRRVVGNVARNVFGNPRQCGPNGCN